MPSPIESPYRIEPCLLENIPLDLADRIAELTSLSELLGARLHPRTAASLADLVRMMNCYYSNLIEGHNTKPRDIERAWADDLEQDESRRNLQIEARAHIRVQWMIDALHAEGTLPEPASIDFLCWLHREFYRDAPEDMLWIENGECGFKWRRACSARNRGKMSRSAGTSLQAATALPTLCTISNSATG